MLQSKHVAPDTTLSNSKHWDAFNSFRTGKWFISKCHSCFDEKERKQWDFVTKTKTVNPLKHRDLGVKSKKWFLKNVAPPEIDIGSNYYNQGILIGSSEHSAPAAVHCQLANCNGIRNSRNGNLCCQWPNDGHEFRGPRNFSAIICNTIAVVTVLLLLNSPWKGFCKKTPFDL